MILSDGGQITSNHIILNESQEKTFTKVNLDTLIPMMIKEHGIGLEDLENRCIRYAMKISKNNVSKAARLLDLSRATLRYRLEKID